MQYLKIYYALLNIVEKINLYHNEIFKRPNTQAILSF